MIIKRCEKTKYAICYTLLLHTILIYLFLWLSSTAYKWNERIARNHTDVRMNIHQRQTRKMECVCVSLSVGFVFVVWIVRRKIYVSSTQMETRQSTNAMIDKYFSSMNYLFAFLFSRNQFGVPFCVCKMEHTHTRVGGSKRKRIEKEVKYARELTH